MIISIHSSPPFDLSGRYARSGFIYQDHIAACFCIEMLTNPLLKAIWLESHDDITIIWDANGNEELEFVQVKATQELSRWSVPKITLRDESRLGTSLVEKSLNQCRCLEKSRFRIVSLFDVNDQLDILKFRVGTLERQAKSNEELKLVEQLNERLGLVTSPKGTTLDEWVKNCWWDKRADSVETLSDTNKVKLDSALQQLGHRIFPDQRNELYQSLLAFCQHAATADVQSNPEIYKITRGELLIWLDNKVHSLNHPAGGTEKLKSKLSKAKVIADYVNNAEDLKWQYTVQRRSPDFVQPSVLKKLEGVVLSELFQLKIELDEGNIAEDDFHSQCISRLKQLLTQGVLKDDNIPEYLALGYMYDLTNRCLHRFNKAQA